MNYLDVRERQVTSYLLLYVYIFRGGGEEIIGMFFFSRYNTIFKIIL
jgi:hypothetical protein